MTVSVLTVDDEPLARAGIRTILETDPGIEVVGEAMDGGDALTQADRLEPDLVLMDIRMPGLNGIEATRRLRQPAIDSPARHRPEVLILTTMDHDSHVFAALRAGAGGFLLKDSPPEDLLAAVYTVARGDALLAPAITRSLINEFARSKPTEPRLPEAFEQLTEREREVFHLVASGLSNSAIAERLHLSEATVKTHVSRVLSKLDLQNRVGAVVLAYESGVLQPGAGTAGIE